MKSRPSLSRLLVLLLPIALGGPTAADAPHTIAFQGVLTDSAGKPKPNGSYNVTFRLYDALSGGKLMWTEANKPVPVSGGRGLFATSLGAPTPFGALPFDKPYFLELQVSGEATPMAPRIPLQSAPYALGNWSLTGNGGTNPAADFLGTTDNQPLVLKANGRRTAVYQDVVKAGETVHTVNILAGSEANTIAAGVVGSTIAGGGNSGAINDLHGDYSIIGGGSFNFVSDRPYVVVGGGQFNGGHGDHSTVGGGMSNTADGAQSTVAGGNGNFAGGPGSTISGGVSNTTGGDQAAVLGGSGNTAGAGWSVVGGGRQNTISGQASMIGSGFNNSIGSFGAFVGGGEENAISSAGGYGAIVGGIGNKVFGVAATVGGGLQNVAVGADSMIPGGIGNIASGTASSAAGSYADASHDGTFVWADHSSNLPFASTARNQFCVRAAGGLVFDAGGDLPLYTSKATTEQNRYLALLNSPITGTASGLMAGDILCSDNFGYARPGKNDMVVKGIVSIGFTGYAGATLNVNGATFSSGGFTASDARFKKDVQPLAGALETINSLRGVSFDWDTANRLGRRFPQGRQIGFIAQDVEKTLPELVFTDSDGYKAVNYQGVVPVLVEGMKEQQREIEALTARNNALETENAAIGAQLRALAAAVANLQENANSASREARR